jgi:hypothetical protein
MKRILVLVMFVATLGLICQASPTINPTKAMYGTVMTNHIDSNVDSFVMSNGITINNDVLVYDKYSCDIYTIETKKPSTNLYAYAEKPGRKKGGKKGGKGKKC